jgi:hypothetical protein
MICIKHIGLKIVLCFVALQFIVVSKAQVTDTIANLGELFFWYKYRADSSGRFIEYVDYCDTSNLDSIHVVKAIPSCVAAYVYKTNVVGIHWINELYYVSDTLIYRREGFVESIKVKHKFLFLRFGFKGCYYKKTGVWITLYYENEHGRVNYNTSGPVCTGILSKNYYNPNLE